MSYVMGTHRFEIGVIPEKGLRFSLICDEPDKCMDDQLPRVCPVQKAWTTAGTDMITADDHITILDLPLELEIQGEGDDAELWLIAEER